MIKINRPAPPNNTKMDRKKEDELWKIKTQIDQGEKPEFRNLWTEKPVKQFLCKYQHDKCCYCEVIRDDIDSDVEHFRPKGKVDENKNHLGYWWLAYEWDNLLIACKACNGKKGSHFPLINEDDRAFNETDDLDKEKPYLINPLKEEPSEFIEFHIKEGALMAKATGKCARGKKTVAKLTGINRRKVILRRVKKIKSCEVILSLIKMANAQERYKTCIDEWTSPDAEFSGLMKFYLREKGYISE